MKLIITRDHFQLHWSEKVSENWNTNLAFSIQRKGYYENYKEDDMSDYGLFPLEL
jgi:iron complex outermembrane receptor protein